MKREPNIFDKFPSLVRVSFGWPRKSIRPLRQMSVSDCGAVSLAMSLEYFGCSVSLSELRNAIHPGRDGATATAIMDAARKYGLICRGVHIDDETAASVPRGSILFWQFRHYVVFDRVCRGGVVIVDPARGRCKISVAEYRKSFTGVAILLEPGQSFVPIEVRTKPYLGLLSLVWERRSLVFRILTTALGAQLLAAVTPFITGVVIDQVVPHKDRSLLLVLAVGYCMLQLTVVAASFLRSYLLLFLQTQLEAAFTLKFLDHLVSLPYRFFQEHTSGDLLIRLGSNTAIRELITSSALGAILDGIFTGLYIFILLATNVRLTVFILLLAAARFLILVVARWRQRRILSLTLDNQARTSTYQIEMLSGMETLKSMGLEHDAAERWSEFFVENLNLNIRRGRIDSIIQAVIGTLNVIASLIVVFYAASLVLDGSLSLGMMISYGALAAAALTSLNSLVTGALQLQLVEVYLDRIRDVLETEAEKTVSEELIEDHSPRDISLEKVSFKYTDDGKWILNEVSLEVLPGSRIALVGRSGCGKSTLARVIAGLYLPSSGALSVSGKDILLINRLRMRRKIGIVTQDTQLFGRSIRSNIALSDPDMSFDRIVKAAKLAAIHHEIISMPMGYETVLSDKGMSLSGGQRQRLAIARAIARNPDLLILDEATSHLDSVTENEVCDALVSLSCTQIIIAHRLSTIRTADTIVMLEDGKIVEIGDHETLMKSKRSYYNLIDSQR